MHFTEDPHLSWMIFWSAILAAGALAAFLYMRRPPRQRRGGDAPPSEGTNQSRERSGARGRGP